MSHDDFARGLGRLGELLGYSAVFPKYGGATDCRWHGVFGNRREAFTFEAKIEHKVDKAITARAVGQAHSQRARAEAELEASGFLIRGLIITHLERLWPMQLQDWVRSSCSARMRSRPSTGGSMAFWSIFQRPGRSRTRQLASEPERNWRITCRRPAG